MNRAEQLHGVNQPFYERLTFSALSRFLSIDTDHPAVADYVRNAFARAVVTAPLDATRCDRGGIFCDGPVPRIMLNNQVVELTNSLVIRTPFQAAFHGSSKLFRLSFRSVPEWLSLYGAALSVEGRAILITARSGTGKTTLALELMARGAHFFTDEYVFVRKSDRFVSGLARTLMVRERALPFLTNGRLQTLCNELPARNTSRGQRVWDFVDVAAVFGEAVLAEPAPLAHVFLLERSDVGHISAENIPASIAAAELLPRVNAGGTGFSRLVEVMSMLAGIPCHRVTAGNPGRTADVVLNIASQ